MRLIDDYQYESEEEEQQTSKKPDKTGEQPDESKITKWIKVSKQRFDVIKKKVQNTKTNKLQVRPKGSKVVNFNK